jgi:hypothetical protein
MISKRDVLTNDVRKEAATVLIEGYTGDLQLDEDQEAGKVCWLRSHDLAVTASVGGPECWGDW